MRRAKQDRNRRPKPLKYSFFLYLQHAREAFIYDKVYNKSANASDRNKR